jgi:hypothetical protein
METPINQLLQLEHIREEINRLLASPLLTTARREQLEARLDQVVVLRAEWDRLRVGAA